MKSNLPACSGWTYDNTKISPIDGSVTDKGWKLKATASGGLTLINESFSNNIYTDVWTFNGPVWSDTTVSAASGKLDIVATGSHGNSFQSFSTILNYSTTLYSVEFDFIPQSLVCPYGCLIQVAAPSGTISTPSGYRIVLDIQNALIKLCRENGVGGETVLQSVAFTYVVGTTYHIKLLRAAGGVFTVSIGGVTKITQTDTNFSSLGTIYIAWAGVMNHVQIDNFLVVDNASSGYSYDTTSPIIEAPWLDCTGFTTINSVEMLENILGGTGSLLYKYALNGGSYNASWLNLAQVNALLSGGQPITVPANGFRWKAQLNSNGSQPCEFVPFQVNLSGYSGGTITKYVNTPVNYYSQQVVVGAPAVVFMNGGYPLGTLVTANPNDCKAGWNTADVMYEQGDIGYMADASVGANKQLIFQFPTAQTANCIALLGNNLVGVIMNLEGSNDGTTYTTLFSNYQIPMDTGIGAWKSFSQATYTYYRVSFNGITNGFFIKYMAITTYIVLPFLEDYDPDQFKCKNINKISDDGEFMGSIQKGVMMAKSLNVGQVTNSEYLLMRNWGVNCLGKGKPFFFIPDSSSTATFFCWPPKDFQFSAPIDGNGMVTVAKIPMEGRAQ